MVYNTCLCCHTFHESEATQLLTTQKKKKLFGTVMATATSRYTILVYYLLELFAEHMYYRNVLHYQVL